MVYFCRVSQLTELISKKPIPPHVKDLILEVMAEDEEGEDVEVRSTGSLIALCQADLNLSQRSRPSSCAYARW